MEIKSFIENFADQFDEMDPSVLTPETEFKQLEGWNSLVALSIIAMIDEEYDVTVKGNDITGATTIEDLFKTVQSKVE
jgi:acyl carrier protein